MKIVRTIVWVLLLVVLVLFSYANWDKVVFVRIWLNGLGWETKLPALVVVSFLAGLVPMWLIHRVSKWTQQRRIAALENAARAAATAPPPPPPSPPQTPDPAAVESAQLP